LNNFYNILPIIINIIALIIIVRIGAVALMITGLNSEKAHFQALSAFTGTGFTTNESERVINNKIRRRIISFLMIFGNGGLLTLFITTTTTFSLSNKDFVFDKAMFLVVGIILLYFLMKFLYVKDKIDIIITYFMNKNNFFEDDATTIEKLHIEDGYVVEGIILKEDSEFINKTVFEAQQKLDNKLIIGIERENKWLPLPKNDTILVSHDVIVVYGRRG
jgi:hypothetical protein